MQVFMFGSTFSDSLQVIIRIDMSLDKNIFVLIEPI